MFSWALEKNENGDYDIFLSEGGISRAYNDSDTAQQIATTLRTMRGEYFLDTKLGTPYFDTVFKSANKKPLLDLYIKSTVLSVPNVSKITAYSSSISNGVSNVKMRILTKSQTSLIIEVPYVI